MKIDWSTVSTILGVIVIVMPVVFGSIAWRLLAIFLPRTEFAAFQSVVFTKLSDLKKDIHDDMNEIKAELKLLRGGRS